MDKNKYKKLSCAYKKPEFVKEKELTFPKEIVKMFGGDKFCFQCSSCHGCR